MLREKALENYGKAIEIFKKLKLRDLGSGNSVPDGQRTCIRGQEERILLEGPTGVEANW